MCMTGLPDSAERKHAWLHSMTFKSVCAVKVVFIMGKSCNVVKSKISIPKRIVEMTLGTQQLRICVIDLWFIGWAKKQTNHTVNKPTDLWSNTSLIRWLIECCNFHLSSVIVLQLMLWTTADREYQLAVLRRPSTHSMKPAVTRGLWLSLRRMQHGVAKVSVWRLDRYH